MAQRTGTKRPFQRDTALPEVCSAFLVVCFLFFSGCSPTHPPVNQAAALARSDELVARYGQVLNPGCQVYLNDVLARTVGRTATNLDVILLNTDSPLALSPGANRILISRGLIRLFSSEAEMVFMLVHEVGHYALGHHELMTGLAPDEAFSARKDLELAADRFAITAMIRSGYDPTLSVQALNDVYRRIKQTTQDGEYPTLQERISNLATTLLKEHQFGGGIADRRVYQECRAQL
jgi:predicted Zn-dependent protease